MAKRGRKSKGFGNIISVRRGMDGLMDVNSLPGAAVAVMAGGAAALGVAMLVRKVAPAVVTVAPASPAVAGLGAGMASYASILGGVAGAAAGAGLAYTMPKYRTAGWVMVASSLTIGALLQWGGRMTGMGGMYGFGAIVPEYSGTSGFGAIMPQMQGLGATVLEDWPAGQRPDSIGGLGGDYGTDINLSGLGAVNTGAFGTPGFRN